MRMEDCDDEPDETNSILEDGMPRKDEDERRSGGLDAEDDRCRMETAR